MGRPAPPALSSQAIRQGHSDQLHPPPPPSLQMTLSPLITTLTLLGICQSIEEEEEEKEKLYFS